MSAYVKSKASFPLVSLGKYKKRRVIPGYLDIPPWGYYHTHTSMKQQKQKLIRRLKIVEGQIRGLQEMIEKDTYCIDVITQTSAVKQALTALEDILIEEHLKTCVIRQMKTGKERQAQEEILKVYTLKRK